jgi:hypothetical protein
MQELKPIPAMALDLFYHHLYLPFRSSLLKLALQSIERERLGEVVDQTFLTETLQVKAV